MNFKALLFSGKGFASMKRGYILIALLVLWIALFAYIASFRVENINVSGCQVVNEQVIKDAVTKNGKTKNTLLVYLSNKMKPAKNIPFVNKVEVEYVSKNTISVTVYEKSMAGCVEYMNGYVFFDKDGMILESSTSLVPGVPCIKGLNFSAWEIGERLPIDDESRFTAILTITQLIEKYQLEIDGIKFTAENEIVLYHEGITIELGKGDYLAIQMMNLGSILKGLEGLEGTLYMKDFNSDDATASFSKRKEEKKKTKEKSTNTDASKEPDNSSQEQNYDDYEDSYDEEYYDEESYDESDYEESYEEDSYDEDSYEESYDDSYEEDYSDE